MGASLPNEREAGFWSGAGEAAKFFMGRGDVLELVRALSLPRELRESLDPSVREKYDELWQAARARDPHE